jgi:hypothetical protein
VNPNADEICDAIDNNCDGSIYEGVLQLFYLDSDGDGFGDNFTTKESGSANGCIILEWDCAF